MVVNIQREQKLINWLFDYRLWTMPFLFLVGVNVASILRDGIYARMPFITYKQIGSVNIVQFSVFWLYCHYKFGKTYSRPLSVYLSFVTLFAAYGAVELFNKLYPIDFFYDKDVYGKSSLISEVFTYGYTFLYPVFFAMHFVPLYYLHLERKQTSYGPFIRLLCYSGILFMIESTLYWNGAEYQLIEGILTRVIVREDLYITSRLLYYLSRLCSILAYWSLL